MDKHLNRWGLIIGIGGTIIATIVGIWALYYAGNQDEDLQREKIRKEYEKIVLMIEQGKTCRNQLLDKTLKGDSVKISDKYDCFKIDSIAGDLLGKFIMKYETSETLAAIDYYIAYYDNKKVSNAKYKDIYQAEINKLKQRRKYVLGIIISKQ